MGRPSGANSTAPIPATTQASVWMNQVSAGERFSLRGLPVSSRGLCKVKEDNNSSEIVEVEEEYAWLDTAVRQLFAILPNKYPEVNCNLPLNLKASCFVRRLDSMMALRASTSSRRLLSVLPIKTRTECNNVTSTKTPNAWNSALNSGLCRLTQQMTNPEA